MTSKKFKLAILDLYDGEPNQGMRCIQEIVRLYERYYAWDVFDVRGKAEVPDLSYNLFISSGGPGSPLDGDGYWDKKYYEWLEAIWKWNLHNEDNKKYVLFICHSFQMACKYFDVGLVTKRKSKSFGTFPAHMTDQGIDEPLFEGLPNPFYVADFRDYQVIQPNTKRLEKLGATILALEKIRPHVPLERAVMSIRFSKEIMGTQFHPEADVEGMLKHFQEPKRKEHVIQEHGLTKYEEMIRHLSDQDKIGLTHKTVIPLFIKNSLEALTQRIPSII